MCMTLLTSEASLALCFPVLWRPMYLPSSEAPGEAHTFPRNLGNQSLFPTDFSHGPFQPGTKCRWDGAWVGKEFPFCLLNNCGQFLRLQAAGFIEEKVLQKKSLKALVINATFDRWQREAKRRDLSVIIKKARFITHLLLVFSFSLVIVMSFVSCLVFMIITIHIMDFGDFKPRIKQNWLLRVYCKSSLPVVWSWECTGLL